MQDEEDEECPLSPDREREKPSRIVITMRDTDNEPDNDENEGRCYKQSSSPTRGVTFNSSQ